MLAVSEERRPSPARPGDTTPAKKISGRKTFGIVDTLGLFIAVTVVAASTSDNTGGIEVANRGPGPVVAVRPSVVRPRAQGHVHQTRRHHHVGVEVVNRIHPHQIVALPKRWIVERTWLWLMNNRRLQLNYNRDPVVTEGFNWAAHTRYLPRRLTSNQRT